jgi:hypothetical protein
VQLSKFVRRSAVSGKVIKLKRKQTREEKIDEEKRKQLLLWLNKSYE